MSAKPEALGWAAGEAKGLLETVNFKKNSMKQEFQYSIKLWLSDNQIIFN